MTVAIVEARGTLEGLELLHAGIVQASALAMRSAIEATEKSAKATTLWKDQSGETRGAIRGEVVGPYGGTVTAGGASRFLEAGTQPHIIRGNPILRFVVAGQVLYRHMVRHPGTEPRPFLEEARRVGEQTLAYGMEYFVNEAVKRAH